LSGVASFASSGIFNTTLIIKIMVYKPWHQRSTLLPYQSLYIHSLYFHIINHTLSITLAQSHSLDHTRPNTLAHSISSCLLISVTTSTTYRYV